MQRSAPIKNKHNKHTGSGPAHSARKRAARRRAAQPHVATAVSNAQRERFAAIALDTQRIVMGDGKYVVKRTPRLSSSSAPVSSVAEPAHGRLPPLLRVSRWTAPGRQLHDHAHCHRVHQFVDTVGVLSSASHKRPGGAYLGGSDDQEDRLARCTTLVASLSSPEGARFYDEHQRFHAQDGSGLYAHSIVYSPGVSIIREQNERLDDYIPPCDINVISAVPVNAAAIRRKYQVTSSDAQMYEEGVRLATKERLTRVLRLFQTRGDRRLVLGAFGCGPSENSVDSVAETWAELLVTGDRLQGTAPFADVFERIVFAVPGKLLGDFKNAFEMRVLEAEVEKATSDEE